MPRAAPTTDREYARPTLTLGWYVKPHLPALGVRCNVCILGQLDGPLAGQGPGMGGVGCGEAVQGPDQGPDQVACNRSTAACGLGPGFRISSRNLGAGSGLGPGLGLESGLIPEQGPRPGLGPQLGPGPGLGPKP